VRARRRLKVGPHWLAPELGHPRSTVYPVLRREGLSRLSHLDRPTAIPIRYEREHPGELVHIDVKNLGRVPAGGGHKMRGRAAARPDHRGDGYDYLHVAVDDRSRWAYVEVHTDERGQTCAGFLRRTAEHLANLGIRIERVMPDRAMNYNGPREFLSALTDPDITHVITRDRRDHAVIQGRGDKRLQIAEMRPDDLLPRETPCGRGALEGMCIVGRHTTVPKRPRWSTW